MRSERIDVIVVHYNRPEFVRAAVTSALDQQDVDTRVIVVDDASHAPPPLDGLLGERVVLIERSESGGPGACQNRGLQAVTAKYVSFLDDDDLYPRYRSVELLRLLLGAEGADVAYGGQVVFNDGDSPMLAPTAAQRAVMPQVPPTVIPGTVLMRSAVAKAMDPQPEHVLIGAFVQWMAAARDGATPPREVSCGLPVLLRRSHSGNVTRRIDPGRDFLTAVRAHRQQASDGRS